MATDVPTEVQVNFIFANYEKKLVLATTLSSSGYELKTKLIENWPEGVPVCEDRSRIRMICMGNGFLAEDKVLGPKFPVFVHPTPINISIRPIQIPCKSPTSFIASVTTVTSTSASRASGVESDPRSPVVETVDQACPPNGRAPRGSYQNHTAAPTSSTRGRGGACCVIN